MWLTHDSGTINKMCECKSTGCTNNTILTCDEVGGTDLECSPASLMICDMKGNRIEWNDLKSGMIVKIRTLHRKFPGYEYLYVSVRGKCLVISIEI